MARTQTDRWCYLPAPCVKCGTLGGRPSRGGTRPQRSNAERHGYPRGTVLCRECDTTLNNAREREKRAREAKRQEEANRVRTHKVEIYKKACSDRHALLAAMKPLWPGFDVPFAVVREVFREPTANDDRAALRMERRGV